MQSYLIVDIFASPEAFSSNKRRITTNSRKRCSMTSGQLNTSLCPKFCKKVSKVNRVCSSRSESKDSNIRVKSDNKYKTKNVNKLKVAFKRLASRKIDVDLSPVCKTKNHSRSDPLNKLDKCILPSNPFILSRRPISKVTKAQKEIINHKIHFRAQSTNDSVQNISHSNTIKQRKPNIPHPSESRNSLYLYSQSISTNPSSSKSIPCSPLHLFSMDTKRASTSTDFTSCMPLSSCPSSVSTTSSISIAKPARCVPKVRVTSYHCSISSNPLTMANYLMEKKIETVGSKGLFENEDEIEAEIKCETKESVNKKDEVPKNQKFRSEKELNYMIEEAKMTVDKLMKELNEEEKTCWDLQCMIAQIAILKV